MKVILSSKANLKLKYYIEEIDYEISGLGVVEKLANGDLYVPDIYLFEQRVTGTETQLDPKDVDKFYDDMLASIPENDPEAREEMFDKIGKIKLWWHSHVNMGVFWSGTDVATQNSLDIDQDVENWWLSIVGNKKGERKAKLNVYKPHKMFLDDLEIVVEEDKDLREQIKKEIEEKVTTPPIVTVPKTVYPYYNNGWGKNKRHQKDYRSAPKNYVPQPRTTDMQNMVEGLEDNYEQNERGIYIPKKGKKLKKANNKKL